MMLAQAQPLDALPAGFWKSFCIALLALIGGVAAVLWIISLVRRPEPTRLQDSPPIEFRKAPKRYNHDATEARFAEIDRRLELHDAELRVIQEDRARTLRHLNRRFERVLVGLASIAGQVGARVPESRDDE
jgi:hypothetical protein